MSCRHLLTHLLFATAALLSRSSLAETAINLSSGVDFSTGKYGTNTSTDVWSLPLQFGVRDYPWSARLTLSYVRLRGDARLIDRDTAISNPANGGPSKRTASGVGDVLFSVARSFTLNAGNGALPAAYMEARSSIKLPTADENKGLGTGRLDLALQADLYAVAGHTTPFLTIGHKWRGSRPDLRLDDGWFAVAGIGYKLTEPLRVGAYFSWHEPVSNRSHDGQETLAYAAFDLDKHWQVLGYGRFGHADSNPDVGAGLQLRYRFNLQPAAKRIQMR